MERTLYDLALSLTSLGEQLARGCSARFCLAVQGQPCSMTSQAVHEAYRIGSEAIRNAFRHSLPTSVDVQLAFSHDRVRLLIVRDDGIGIDESALRAGSLPGHWGLQGTRERAQSIGGVFEVRSRPGAGTEIELLIPKAIAYRRGTIRSRWLLRGRSVALTGVV